MEYAQAVNSASFVQFKDGCVLSPLFAIGWMRGEKASQGQWRPPLITDMCRAEEALCKAIKQVYRAPLPTSLSPTSHLCDKMPSGWSEHHSGPADSSGITTPGDGSEEMGNGRELGSSKSSWQL